MNLDHSPDAEAYRRKVALFLDNHLPANWLGVGSMPPEEQDAFRRTWRRTLQQNRLLAVSWPVEHGGAGLSPLEQLIVAEEFTRRGVPQGGLNDNASIQMLGGTLLVYGTEEQKRRYLPRILDGEDVWCQGFSEPEAGSDLAGVRTQARLEDGTWIISGQKTWTSYGHLATHVFVLCRTDPDTTRHRGLSLLLCPLDQPGIVVRPLQTMTGEADFNEVFFDDAVCDEADVLGPVGAGWEVARTLLGFERGEATATLAAMFRDDFDQLLALADRFGRLDDPVIRQRLARVYEGVEQMRCSGLAAVTQWLAGKQIGAESSMHKLFWSEWLQSTTSLAMDVMGADAVTPAGPGLTGVTFPAAEAGALRDTGTWVDYFLRARAATIYAGSSEIQRNIVAERLLDLPRNTS
ncbi:MAG: putative Acyl-CoA dehydrogenase [Acidimicrobiaceae bacterium]|nr:putative Acyl-CoA dehydrogenase [Acidimicrobiaceae bacterium]